MFDMSCRRIERVVLAVFEKKKPLKWPLAAADKSMNAEIAVNCIIIDNWSERLDGLRRFSLKSSAGLGKRMTIF